MLRKHFSGRFTCSANNSQLEVESINKKKYKLLICIEKCFSLAFILLRDSGKALKRQLCLSHLRTWWRL